MRVLGPLCLLMVAVLAGCADTDPAASPAPPVEPCQPTPFDVEGVRFAHEFEDPIDDDMANATNADSTAVRTCSLPPIGWHALSPDGVPHKYIGEIDMRGDLDLGAVAVLGNGEAPRVYVLDISNRSVPVVVSMIDQVGTYVVDVKISDDGLVLYTASQANPGAGFVTSMPEGAAFDGFSAYSIVDPANPVYLGTVVDPNGGCHMLDPVQVAANQDAIFCVSQNVRSYLVQRDGGRLLNLGFVDYLPTIEGRPTTSSPGVPDPLCDPTLPLPPAVGTSNCLFASGPHDMTAFHEGGSFGTGRSYMVVSHWDEGVKVLDITDAPLVTEAGSWNGEGATHYDGNVHTAMMFVVGSDRYIIASPELTSDGAVPSLWVLDANDLSQLRLVGEWFHPGEHESQGLYLTTHQWQVAPTGPDVNASDVRVYLTYNHAGIWVLDFGQMLAKDNHAAILGYNLARPELPEDHVPTAILSTWDVNVVDGYISGSDRATGLWVFHYTGDGLGDTRLRGFS
jgi:hypothetical protein